jgi:hypothetical protein
MGRLDVRRRADLRPVSIRATLDRLAPDWGVTPTTLFVARYPGEDGDDGFLRFETLTRLTEGVDWP